LRLRVTPAPQNLLVERLLGGEWGPVEAQVTPPRRKQSQLQSVPAAMLLIVGRFELIAPRTWRFPQTSARVNAFSTNV